MKDNFRFFGVVLVFLLISSFVLVECMHVIAADYGDAKAYNPEGPTNRNGVISDSDTPMSQAELKKKFGAMYNIREDGKTITVISKEYLNNYWQSNDEKEVIHSLTVEEVYFIIQDSVRIYMEYEKVILTGFHSGSSVRQVAERFPDVKGREVVGLSMSRFDCNEIRKDIYAIILYRLKALSSPKAFFTGAEAIRFVGDEPAKYSSMYPEAVFYIPGYSADTDREYILSAMGVTGEPTDLTAPEKFTDLFLISCLDEAILEFRSKTGGKTFPAALLLSDVFGAFKDADPETYIFRPCFALNVFGTTFRMMMEPKLSDAVCGTYVQDGGKLILYASDYKNQREYRYVFQEKEGVGYRYIRKESDPVFGCDFEDGTIFYRKKDSLKSKEK